MTFEFIPIVDKKSVLLINKNLTEEKIKTNVNMFINDIKAGNIYKEADCFSWYEKEIPLTILYLLWKGINVMVPYEEIMQVIAYEKYKKGLEYLGSEQWWHMYADAGFDVFTGTQLKRFLKQNKAKYNYEIWESGLVLLSTNPGIKFETRNNDKNDPLDWNKKKEDFDYSCAICGDKEGNFSSSNGIPVRLEQGHIDSRLPKSHSNIIPQCGSCNNHTDKYLYGPDKNNPKKYIVIEKLNLINRN